MDEIKLENLDGILSWVFKIGTLIIIAAIFFFFWNLTTDFYETPKFLTLTLFIGSLLILTALKYITQGKVLITLTPLDLPFLALGTVAIISTFFSASPLNSIISTPLKIHGGLVTTICYILFYYLLVNNLKQGGLKIIINTLLICAGLLSIVTIASYGGLKLLPFGFTQGLNFTPTGPSFSTAAILAMLLPFPLLSALNSTNSRGKLVQLVLLVLFGTVIVLIGSWPVFTAAGACFILALWTNGGQRKTSPMGLISLIGPILIIALIAFLSFTPPIGGAKNPLYNAAQNFPREVTLPFVTSWKISVSSFRDSPFFGTGPSTYLYNFTQYKPIEFNSSEFWNVRFDNAFNEYLLILSTLGGLGLLAFVALTGVFMVLSLKSLAEKQGDSLQNSLSISGIVFFIILSLHPSTLTVMVTGIIILGLFITSRQHTRTLHLRLGTSLGAAGGAPLDIFPVILLLVFLGAVGYSGTYIGKFTLADYYHRRALNSVAGNNALDAYNALVTAEKYNPYADLYRSDLAQTNFAIANAIAINKGPTPSSPSGSLTDADRQSIQQLLQQAINEGRVATALNPRNVGNWETLGNIYRQISGVAQNALDFSLDSYGRAIQLDPLNPLLRLNVGGIYYSFKNYDMAIRFFSDAVNIKPDFANGYYNLSVALRDKGNLGEAQIYAERTVSLVDVTTPDYKLAADYLADLRARIATGSATQSQIKAPAAVETGPLQRRQQPVLNLPEKQDIATPEAVKKE